MNVGKYQSEDPFVCFGTKPTQRACTWDFPQDWKRTREGRSQRIEKEAEQKRPGQNRKEVDRTGQSAKENRSRGKPTARMCGPRGPVGQCGRMSQHSWWLGGNFARIHTCNSSECYESVTNFSLLVLRAIPNPCLFVLFSSILSVVYVVFCVSVKKLEIPLARDKKPLDDLMTMSGLRGWDSGGGSASGVLSHFRIFLTSDTFNWNSFIPRSIYTLNHSPS